MCNQCLQPCSLIECRLTCYNEPHVDCCSPTVSLAVWCCTFFVTLITTQNWPHLTWLSCCLFYSQVTRALCAAGICSRPLLVIVLLSIWTMSY